MMIMMIPES